MSTWTPRQWQAPEIDGLSPQVIKYDSSPEFLFYVHDHAAKGAIVAHGARKTLKAAQTACDAALAGVLAERAQHAAAVDAMVAEGAPEVAGQAVACG